MTQQEKKPDRKPETIVKKYSRMLRIGLWVAAVLLMFSAVVYQRLTGPTHPRRGGFSVADANYKYKLIRSENSTTDASVIIPDPEADASAVLFHRRYKAGDDYTTTQMVSDEGKLIGNLPKQPPAGKLEYYIELNAPEGLIRIPAAADDSVIIRFKGPVPGWALLPHILLMFFAILVGMRAGLSAIFTPSDMRRWSWITLGLISVGGMIMGPVVQKFAFGAYWTGFPLGYDLTDNKTLIMWLAWIGALALITFWKKKTELTSRLLILAACVVMVWVYLIPHSMRGSELDYSKLEEGADPTSAITTGD